MEGADEEEGKSLPLLYLTVWAKNSPDELRLCEEDDKYKTIQCSFNLNSELVCGCFV